MSHRLKILAPAGDTSMLRAAVFSGADSVYLGVQGFNARRSAQNFSAQALAEATAFCHARGCEVYAAINTLVLPGRQAAAAEAVQAAALAGCDAIIVQDLAVAKMAQALAPGLALHASTQMSVHSLAGVLQLEELGFSRVILARELSFNEIAAIAAASPIELEVFVHGALCFSVSGQCSMSAFLGGRSANRGGCAGPCRLPFRAEMDAAALQNAQPADAGCHHLSLKDLSILADLPRLEAIGVAAAKIEGRLRGPEYTAVAVDAAHKALNKEQYDAELLQNVFSRTGFTDEWFQGKTSADAFGARSEADARATKAALPKARELYRREGSRVPVDMHLALTAQGAALTVCDGTHTVVQEIQQALPQAEKPAEDALLEALAKTGGTPFYLRDAQIDTQGFLLRAAQANALRRDALARLLALREAPVPHAVKPEALQALLAGRTGQAEKAPRGKPLLRARFETLAQMPGNAAALCTQLLLPLDEAEQVPAELRSKTWLWLPRVLFGGQEQAAQKRIEATRALGFAGYEVQNIAHWKLCAGLPMSAGFGLNVANALALDALPPTCSVATLSPELTLAQMAALAADAGTGRHFALDALAYGTLPLMITRACPLKQLPGAQNCDACPKRGAVVDRKGNAFPLYCKAGLRSIHNTVPLWMAERLGEMPVHTATLYFTDESRQQAAEVLEAFATGKAAPGAFTRGLYYRGTEE